MFSQLWNCNRLWKIWYTILMVSLQSYVIFNGIRQYINFKSQYYNPRYGERWNVGPLHFNIGCIIIAIALMGFFLYFSLVNFKSVENSSVRCLLDKDDHQSSFREIGKLVWKLVLAKLSYCQILHFTIAICLMLPVPVIHMEEIRNDALSPDSIWKSNIDFFSEHFEWYKTESVPSTVILRNIHYVTKSSTISIEFINFTIASILIVLKLPAVFWSAHRGFSIIYSMLLFSNCLTSLMLYESGSILIKYSGQTEQLESNKGLSSKIIYPVTITLMILHFSLTLLSFLAVFAYGSNQVVLSWLFRFKCVDSTDSGFKRGSGLVTLVITLGFLLLIPTLAINSIIYASLLRLYQVSKSSILMFTIILGIVHLTLNFLTWFTFAIKTKWIFKPEYSKTTQRNQNSMDHVYKIANGADAIYGCFHNNVTLSSSSSHSSGPGTMRTIEGANSECSGHGANFQNYIYMHSNALHIPTISEDYDENQNTSMKSVKQARDKASTSTFDEFTSRNQDIVSVSDHGINHSNENVNSDSYRSLQMYDVRKFGKLVKFEGMDEENNQLVKFYEKRLSSSHFEEKDLKCLKVPDILNLNRSNMSCRSQSESSLDQISSSASSKNAVDQSDHGLCSEV